MPKFVQFTSAHFPDLNPNSYDNLDNMKLKLNSVSQMSPPKSNIASANDQGPFKFKSQGNFRFLLRVLLCIF